MVFNVQEVPSCPLAHCTQFPALLSAPSFAWHCLTMWLFICLAPDSTLILSWLSFCDHKQGGGEGSCHSSAALMAGRAARVSQVATVLYGIGESVNVNH